VHISPDGASRNGRDHNLQRLQEETFDLLVIGGGINGAGIARDAALRGLRVALVEKGDFASGTSSKSSKLIHGGVRYLQHGDFRLVRVACRERDLLRRRLAPHLVQPLAFLFPVYRGDPVGFFTLGAGMWLYDLLAIFRNIRTHRMLTAKRLLHLEPNLRREGLRGAALYYDCFTDDARLTLETILAAAQEGAVTVNYLQLKDFVKENGRIIGACLGDHDGGSLIQIRARQVVNATGPWVDFVRKLDDPVAPPALRLTKGAHIVVRRDRIGNDHAVVMHSPRDKRVLFVIPWETHDIIGTTDTDFSGSLDDITVDDSDASYLLEAANWHFPAAALRPDDIISSYAGVRPLVASGKDEDPSAVSREESIIESQSGLITLVGGKLTTYRFVAEEIVDLVTARLNGGVRARRKPRLTAEKPLLGSLLENARKVADELAANGDGLTREQIEHLVGRYGARAPEVMALLRADSNLKQLLVPGMPDIWAEAVYAAQAEMAMQPDDILFRRTQIGLKDPAESSQITALIQEKLDTYKTSVDS
jgi:glycerol-3-phosphate dehydrogenase